MDIIYTSVVRLKWPKFISPYTRFDCPDGPKLVLKKPEKAFSVVAPDWEVRIKAIAEAFGKAQVDLGAELKKKFKTISDSIGERYVELQMHYLAAYLEFATNPCGRQANRNLTKANRDIRAMELRLRWIEVETERLMRQRTTLLARGTRYERPSMIGRRRKAVRMFMKPTNYTQRIERLVSGFRTK